MVEYFCVKESCVDYWVSTSWRLQRKEKKEEEEEKEEEEKSDKMVQIWRPRRFQRDYIIKDPSVTCGSLGKVAGSDGQEFRSTNENASQVKAMVESSKPQRSACRLPL